jgi:hypothetical protein
MPLSSVNPWGSERLRPDNPYSLVYDAPEGNELLDGCDIISNEVYFFDKRHYGVFGKLLPDSIVDLLGRKWGWHRIIYAKYSPAK